MASTGSAVSHRGTMEGSVSGVGAEGSQFVASGNLAQNFSEDIQIATAANYNNSSTELQQSADTATECPDPTGHPIPLTPPPGSASPGRQFLLKSFGIHGCAIASNKRTVARAGGARALAAARVAKRKAAKPRRNPWLAKKAPKANICS